MKVKLDQRSLISGRWYEPGDTVDLYDGEARQLIERGRASEVKKRKKDKEEE